MLKFKKVEVLANVASGSVGPDAPQQIEAQLAGHGISVTVRAPAPDQLITELQAAVDAGPDLLILLAGDGTIRAAAELCGPDGPMIAPLPGGTMNMLPYAVYGQRRWPEALELALTQGYEQAIGGGEVEGHSFLVAGIFGPLALWAPAREAARHGNAGLAWLRAQRAFRRAFTGRLRYSLDVGQTKRAEALVFMCPLTSKAMDNDAAALESAALDVRDLRAAFRLGFHALTGDWRHAPGVEVEPCGVARVWSKHGIPAILDGETVKLPRLAEVRYKPKVARILAIPKVAVAQ